MDHLQYERGLYQTRSARFVVHQSRIIKANHKSVSCGLFSSYKWNLCYRIYQTKILREQVERMVENSVNEHTIFFFTFPLLLSLWLSISQPSKAFPVFAFCFSPDSRQYMLSGKKCAEKPVNVRLKRQKYLQYGIKRLSRSEALSFLYGVNFSHLRHCLRYVKASYNFS